MEHRISHSNLMEYVLTVYKDCKICSYPIDCYSVLRNYGFRLYSYADLKEQNPQIYKLAMSYTSDSFIIGDIVAFNNQKNQNRISFSLMHELGHYVLGHKHEDPQAEKDADRFASHFLAPRIMIHKFRCLNADQIHESFGLSYAASNRALMSYKKWFNKICQTTRRPLESEKQLESMFFVQTGKPDRLETCSSYNHEEDESIESKSEWLEYYKTLRIFYPERLQNYIIN